MAVKQQYPNIVRVISQEYHRNGVGGAGTVVSLFEPYFDPSDYEPGEAPSGVFIAMSVSPDRRENPTTVWSRPGVKVTAAEKRKAITEHKMRDFATHTYAVSLDMANDGNIRFMENSWRAGDHWGPGLAEAWRKQCKARDEYGPGYDPFAAEPEEVAEVEVR